MTMLLAIDTSTRQCGIALYDVERAMCSEHHWLAGRQHTVELMPEIAHLMARAHVEPGDLAGVAVALGPGSFTGVRVALAAGKGLAIAQNIPLLGVPTLDIIAYPHQAQPWPVIAILQAGRGRVCWSMYAHGSNGWAARTAPTLSTLAGLAEAFEGPAVFAGEISPADRGMLQTRGESETRVLSPALSLRRAGYLAELAWARLEAGEHDDPASLSPIYLQEPITHPKPERG